MDDQLVRLGNINNHHQDILRHPRVLCVCSAGMLRSATMAWVLSNDPYNYNTRCVGVREYAVVPVDQVLVYWADEIVCAAEEHLDALHARYDIPDAKRVFVLGIPDRFSYRDPELVEMIKLAYDDVVVPGGAILGVGPAYKPETPC